MKKLSPYYTDGRIRYNRKNGSYFYQDENNYLLAKGIYKVMVISKTSVFIFKGYK